MFQNLDVFRLSHAMTVHAATRQALLAQNMANADTPGYAARDLPRFSEVIGDDRSAFGLRVTRASHLNGPSQGFGSRIFERVGETNPNGNSVSLETEMLHAADARQQHDRALSIYRSSLGVLRTAIGRP